MSSHKFLVHQDGDYVGVAVQDIKAGEKVLGVEIETGKEYHVKSNHDIPLGHKIALQAIKNGTTMIKYGENVGTTTADIKICLLYTSDAADEEDSVDLGGRRIIKKKKKKN